MEVSAVRRLYNVDSVKAHTVNCRGPIMAPSANSKVQYTSVLYRYIHSQTEVCSPEQLQIIDYGLNN